MRWRTWAHGVREGVLVLIGLLAAGYIGYVEWAKRSARATEETSEGAASPAHAPEAADRSARDTEAPSPHAGQTIRIGWTAWADAEIVTHVVQRLLEDRMGYDVELTMADIGIQYQGVGSGELDVMLMAWLPVTHGPYWERVSGSVVNLGPIYTRAQLGWVVPAYVPEDVLGSMADLTKPEVQRRIGHRIQGIDPGSGLMQASERAMEVYGLDELELVASSGAAMTAGLGRAIDRKEWIVVTAWNPHWMFAEWDLRYLEDPEGVLGGRERIHALVRRGFYQHWPSEVTELLARMFIPLDELEEALLVATRDSVDEAVDRYLRDHAGRAAYWVTGEVSSRDAQLTEVRESP